MPKFIIETTSYGTNQEEVEARDEVDALANFLQHPSNIARVLEDYDEESDPHGSYRPHGKAPWKFVKISVGRSSYCDEAGCLIDREDDSDYCEDHREENDG